MIRVANAPCSWGVLEFGIEGRTLGYRDVLGEMKETGYAGTELGDWGFLPTDPARLRSELDTFGLDLVGAFVPVALSETAKHQAGVDAGVRTARLMADAGYRDALVILADDNATVPDRVVNAGRVTPGLYLDRERWEALRSGAERFSRAVFDATGLKTAFHHHCGGYVETPGEIEKLLVSVPAQTMGLVLDTGHYLFGGGYPEAAIGLFGERICHVHFKDCSATIAQQSRSGGWDYFESLRNGVFCELGLGAVAFASIVEQLRARRYDGWIVIEQDVLPGMGSPMECARRNREYLRTHGL